MFDLSLAYIGSRSLDEIGTLVVIGKYYTTFVKVISPMRLKSTNSFNLIS